MLCFFAESLKMAVDFFNLVVAIFKARFYILRYMIGLPIPVSYKLPRR
jgi:hypothetical protein